jgi:glycosyltransferase involved in cell wall biosynthesis
MTSLDLSRVLFVGRAGFYSTWFRCALPAMQLGADWCGVAGDPPELEFATGVMRRPTILASLFDYDVVVLQEAGARYAPLVGELRAAGVTVLYETDQDLEGLCEHPKDFLRELYSRPVVDGMLKTMAACDGLIVPTPFLVGRYRDVNARAWVCRNGVDLGRFALTRTPDPEHVVIGWAGHVGHEAALTPWLATVLDVMRKHPNVRFHSLGAPYADVVERTFPGRALSLPWNDLISFPAGMIDVDIALAPSAPTPFFRGKSDLRWLEASALSIPVVADPGVYGEIEHGVTGFHAGDLDKLERVLTRLVRDAALRARVGAAAREHVSSHRSIAAMAPKWITALTEAAARLEMHEVA